MKEDVLARTGRVPQVASSDLVSISQLPTLWVHKPAYENITGLVQVLLSTIPLDLVYVCLNPNRDGHTTEYCCSIDGEISGEHLHRIAETFASFFHPDRADSVFSIRNPISQRIMQIVVLRIGMAESHGFVVAGSSNTDFPNEHTQLILQAAVNQAAAMLEQKTSSGSCNRSIRS